METKEKLDELMTRAVEAELDGVELFKQFPIDDIQREYNGIGPASLKPELRAKLSRYLALFLPAVLIHDLRYAASDLFRGNFNFANLEFRENCLKLANHAYGILNWRRYRAWFVAELLFAGVASDYGWQAWCDAGRKNID